MEMANFFMDDLKSQYPKPDHEAFFNPACLSAELN
jgi:hypothetical protein